MKVEFIVSELKRNFSKHGSKMCRRFKWLRNRLSFRRTVLESFLPENSRFHSSNQGDINEITDTNCNGVKFLLK